ncbi:aminotransferase class V-fold PLP-dependent enzyme [Gordonia terrae]|uniref:aminotransferase class V-fold PLP-dependent enzyme n=1 Tax=Gordonia terrae TaxID=2055 RepID=UPI003F6BA655
MTAVLSAPATTGDAARVSRFITRRHEAARESLRRLVRGRVDDTVLVTRDIAGAIGLAMHIAPGDVVILSSGDQQGASRWGGDADGHDRSRTVAVREAVEETLAAVEGELSSRPACLLAVLAATDAAGEVLPLGRLASIAHRHGARIFVDAERLVAHRPISIVSHGIDYVAFSAARSGAGSASGVLIGRPDWFDAARPHPVLSDLYVAGFAQEGINGRLEALTPPTARTPDHCRLLHRTDPTSTRGI